MLTMALAGFCMCVTVFVLMARINIKRFLGYPNFVDIVFTIFMIHTFAGTFSGAAAGAVAGIVMSLMLWVLRCTIGAERLSWRKGRFGVPQMYWRVIPPSEIHPHWITKLFTHITSKQQEA